MKQDERIIRNALDSVEVPDERRAEQRAWEIVRAAQTDRSPQRASGRARRWGLQIALVGALVAVVASPAGAAVRHWIADFVSPGVEHSRPVLTSLPGGGSLLVQSGAGPWIVHSNGSKRLLGEFDESTWSPHGLFIAATSRHELVALDPAAQPRWTVAGEARVGLPSWNSPDGFRIAYLSGSSLRVVDGDGTRDRRLERFVAPVKPAWMPGPKYVLSFARRDGSVETVRADSGATVFRTAAAPQISALQWTSDGKLLLVVRNRDVELLDSRGVVHWRWDAPAGTEIVAAKPSPFRDRAALILTGSGHSQLVLVGPGSPARTVFSGPGLFSGVEWSPNGRWLLLAWESANQWLFLSRDHPGRIVAVSNISEQFAPGRSRSQGAAFPRVEGWSAGKPGT